MTSKASFQEMQQEMEGAYHVVKGTIKSSELKARINASFQCTIIGGSAKGASAVIASHSIEDVMKLIQDEAVTSDLYSAAPIAYQARYVLDNKNVDFGAQGSYMEYIWKPNPKTNKG